MIKMNLSANLFSLATAIFCSLAILNESPVLAAAESKTASFNLANSLPDDLNLILRHHSHRHRRRCHCSSSQCICPQGPIGPQGPQGPQGIPGANTLAGISLHATDIFNNIESPILPGEPLLFDFDLSHSAGNITAFPAGGNPGVISTYTGVQINQPGTYLLSYTGYVSDVGTSPASIQIQKSTPFFPAFAPVLTTPLVQLNPGETGTLASQILLRVPAVPTLIRIINSATTPLFFEATQPDPSNPQQLFYSNFSVTQVSSLVTNTAP